MVSLGPMHLVVGLGNPGPQYADNRHNLGFMVADELARRGRAGTPREKFGAELLEATIGGNRLLLCKPKEYMNVSGQAVARAAGFWKIGLAETIVVHDELDLPFGTVRGKAGGGAGGHNGVRSVMGGLGTGDFLRVRLGIGRPPAEFRGDEADWVLMPFTEPADEVEALIDGGASFVEAVLEEGMDAAIARFHAAEPGSRARRRHERRATAEAEVAGEEQS